LTSNIQGTEKRRNEEAAETGEEKRFNPEVAEDAEQTRRRRGDLEGTESIRQKGRTQRDQMNADMEQSELEGVGEHTGHKAKASSS